MERTKIGEMRPSQFITTFGPGAIVDLPHFSVIVGGTHLWDTKLCARISEPRLEAKYELKQIYAPPALHGDFAEPTLPTFRFPRYMVCPTCRRLDLDQKFRDKDSKGILYCHHLGTDKSSQPAARAFPVRFIAACPRGHISDLPWEMYAHAKHGDGKVCAQPRLFLEELGATGSISNVTVRCACGAQRSLADAFREKKDPKTLGKCPGHRPWLGKAGSEINGCGKTMRAMLRGASNLYFPMVDSALTIPPHADNPAYDILGEVEERLADVSSLDELKKDFKYFPEATSRNITPEQLWDAYTNKQAIPRGVASDLHYPEWLELLKGNQIDAPYDFETAEQDVPVNLQPYLGRLIQVQRLREVRVLTGFTRIDPPANASDLVSADHGAQPASYKAPLSKYSKPWWLPGVMVRGEGIFLTLNEERLHSWETSGPILRAEVALEKVWKQFHEDRGFEVVPPFPGARYVLLHTLAHSLIRQLGLNSGYSSTALRERIYCRKTPGQEMAGLLIYTATPDSEGSLGGLVEQGETDRFGAAVWQALQSGLFCSGDPLCAEHDPAGHNDLNGAACHACTLLAETSCERANRLLDRSFLVPTVARPDLAYFGDLL